MLQCNQWNVSPAKNSKDGGKVSRGRRRIGSRVAGLLVLTSLCTSPGYAEDSEFAGLIRAKRPDRSSYQPPVVAKPTQPRGDYDSASAAPEDPLANIAQGDASPVLVRGRARQVNHEAAQPTGRVQQASYEPQTFYEEYAEPIYGGEAVCGAEPGCGFEPACGCESAGYACDGSCGSCASGCDAYACGPCAPRLCMDPCQWFGSVELLMMWRVGDGLPILATTSTTATGTGVIGAAGTRTLFGGERVLDELTAGGRVTIGTWLDSQHCRSLVFRGWGAEDDHYDFFTNEDRDSRIARPFFNVTDGVTAANGSQVIAAPSQFDGSISIEGSNSVYGGDVSLRQRWLGGLGGFVDVLYGYQYMRMEDDLRISTSSTVLPGNVNEGAILDVMDLFDAENEFHGGQLGLAARYRERCWSFNGTIKAAVGSLNRTATRNGASNRSLAGVNAPDPNGLLVRSTNEGTVSDSTFAWVPELDATLGWRWTQNLDLTFGYHVVAMTDALQASGMIDKNLAVNAADNPTGQQRPNGLLRYDTFYVHGIHFGVQCVY
ncbi:MAG: BBP7 family outer membrane beta-barrel protein [Planctomycetaceae bacterium]